MMPKMTPKWSQRGSQNEAKIVKNEVLEASCFQGGSQVASRPPSGSILERFWDPFGNIFVSFSDIFLVFLFQARKDCYCDPFMLVAKMLAYDIMWA